jgi:RNA polymerase sigma factor (TIGR02999 family)
MPNKNNEKILADAAPGEFTRLLESAQNDSDVYGKILPLVYDELKKLARARMARERPGLTLQATALVNEAYLRLVGSESVEWQNKAHFFGAAAEAMRRILIDRARRYAAMKHGGEFRRTEYAEEDVSDQSELLSLLEWDEALDKLEEKDPEMAQVVKLRYFAGLTVGETAQAMDVSPRSVNRLWTSAQAWLKMNIG